ncbi:MAG: excinuclease ABC subunit A, partial [Amphiplicatus sp.]|nr:excinuclease ABC subunit A [Amphiplicatus sp.]
PATGLPIESQTVSQMVDKVLALDEGTRLFLLAPIARGRKGEFRKELAELMKKGFQRVKIDGTFYEIEEAPALDKKFKHDVEVVVDRLVVRDDLGTRLSDSIETALGLTDGLAIVEFADETDENGDPRRLIFSEKFACPVSGFTIAEIEPRLFSFNNPFGACPVCDGLGSELKIDPDLVVPDASLSLDEGAIAPWSRSSAPYYQQTLKAICDHFDGSLTRPFETLNAGLQEAVLYGTGKTPINFIYDDGLRTYKTTKPFEGVIGNLERRYRETESQGMREEIGRYMSNTPCETCGGLRLKPEALAVKIGGLNISQVADMSIRQAAKWFVDVEETFTPTQKEIGARILKEIRERLAFLNDVGLDYLTLSRGSGSLSGGESQRIRLASQIGSGLTGVLYVLDEPSIGLHQRDNERLLETLRRLRDL